MVEMVVLGEDDPTSLQRKIGFESLRNVWSALSLTPVKGIRRSKPASPDEATDAQQCLPLKGDA
jgi:hypothetical protein